MKKQDKINLTLTVSLKRRNLIGRILYTPKAVKQFYPIFRKYHDADWALLYTLAAAFYLMIGYDNTKKA